MSHSFTQKLAAFQHRVDTALNQYLPADDPPEHQLSEAIRYSVIGGGGKRIRPAMVYAAGEAVGADQAVLDLPAAAVEMIHAYSLIHDDLPAMDDDDLRRGRPTNHKQFDEATAILSGDGLLTLAFNVLARSIQVQALTPKGRKVKKKFTGWEARIFQHEYDHLDGVVYIDHLTEEGRSEVQPRLDELVQDFGDGGAL